MSSSPRGCLSFLVAASRRRNQGGPSSLPDAVSAFCAAASIHLILIEDVSFSPHAMFTRVWSTKLTIIGITVRDRPVPAAAQRNQYRLLHHAQKTMEGHIASKGRRHTGRWTNQSERTTNFLSLWIGGYGKVLFGAESTFADMSSSGSMDGVYLGRELVSSKSSGIS